MQGHLGQLLILISNISIGDLSFDYKVTQSSYISIMPIIVPGIFKQKTTFNVQESVINTHQTKNILLIEQSIRTGKLDTNLCR